MNHFILTCCNSERETSLFSLLYFNTEKLSLVAFDISCDYLTASNFIGVTGIVEYQNKYYISVQSFPNSKVLILNEEFNVEECIELEKNYDLHSMYVGNMYLYLTCTSSNQVMKINLEDRTQEIEWEYKTNQKLHLNTFKVINNIKYALMHNSFLSKDKNIHQGALIDLTNNKEIVNNLKNPHDIFVYNNAIYTSSSARGVCFKYDLEKEEKSVYKRFDGYLRGIYIDDSIEIYLLSSSRLYSRKKGIGIKQVKNFDDYYSDTKYESFIYFYDKKSGLEKKLNTTSMVNEFYDCIKIENKPTKNLHTEELSVLRTKAFRKRISTLTLQLSKLNEEK